VSTSLPFTRVSESEYSFVAESCRVPTLCERRCESLSSAPDSSDHLLFSEDQEPIAALFGAFVEIGFFGDMRVSRAGGKFGRIIGEERPLAGWCTMQSNTPHPGVARAAAGSELRVLYYGARFVAGENSTFDPCAPAGVVNVRRPRGRFFSRSIRTC